MTTNTAKNGNAKILGSKNYDEGVVAIVVACACACAGTFHVVIRDNDANATIAAFCLPAKLAPDVAAAIAYADAKMAPRPVEITIALANGNR